MVSLAGFFSLDRWHLRRMVMIGCLLMAGGFGLSCAITAEFALLGLQAGVGVGAGLMLVSALGLLGRMDNPDAMVALMMVGASLGPYTAALSGNCPYWRLKSQIINTRRYLCLFN